MSTEEPKESSQVVKTESVVTGPPQPENSSIFGVSVRAWIALAFACGIVGNQILVTIASLTYAIIMKDFALVGSLTTVGEPFATLAGIAVGFYFGQKLK